MKTLILLWHVLKTLASFKKSCEAKGEARMTRERGLEDRLKLERIAHSLKTGDTKNLPKTVQWVFAHTKLDNHLGEYFEAILKSDKLKTDDKALNEPYRVH